MNERIKCPINQSVNFLYRLGGNGEQSRTQRRCHNVRTESVKQAESHLVRGEQ